MYGNADSMTVTGSVAAPTTPVPPQPAKLVPICAQCHRVRLGKQWVAMSTGLGGIHDACWTHGLCPDCLRLLYPDIAETVLNEIERQQTPPLV